MYKKEYVFDEHKTLTVENIDGIPTAFDADILALISYFGTQHNSLTGRIHFTLNDLSDLFNNCNKNRIKESILRMTKTLYTAQGTILSKFEGKTTYLNKTMLFHIIESSSFVDTEKKKKYNRQQVLDETWVRFNEYFINNFISNYVQYINFEKYLKLKMPTAKRLYVYLEKKHGSNSSFTINIFKLAAVIPIESKEGFNIRKLLKEACKHLVELNIIKNYSFADNNITFEFPAKPKKIIQENKQLRNRN